MTSPQQWIDPAPGSLVIVSPGQMIEIGLSCPNDQQKVVTFTAEVDGTGSWPMEVTPAHVVPFETGAVRIQITPVQEAQEGDYPLTIRLLCDEDPVEPGGTRSLVLRLSPPSIPRKAAAEPVPTSAVVDAPPSKPRKAPAKKAEPAPPAPQVEEAERPTSQQTEPEPEPINAPSPKPMAPPEPKVVTLEPVPPPDEEEEPEPLVAADTVVSNPPEGTVLNVRPGEMVLVRFDVKNEQSGVRTYVLQEDRSLPTDWIHLVREQVNVTPGGTGELGLLLKPPASADPTSYPFTASFGELGKPLSPCYLTLAVLPTPATRIIAPSPKVSAGPFARSVAFSLSVESAGNSDTAYRLAVIAESESEDDAGALHEVYEIPAWQYLFDREYDNLIVPSSGRSAPPVTHKLQAIRKGVWWFGWREHHHLKVRSVPVTDPGNNGKAGNVAELTAVRWRLLPLPLFVVLPIVLLLVVLLGSGGSNLRVHNGLQGSDASYYVLGTEPGQESLGVRLAWSSPFYALLKVEKTDQGRASPIQWTRNAASDDAKVVKYGQAQRVIYELKPRLFGSGIQANVRLVPIRSVDMLRLSVANAALKGLPGKEPIGEDKVDASTRDIVVMVPKTGSTSIVFKNLTGAGSVRGQTIVLWTVRPPDGFRINYFLSAPGDNQVINPGAAVTANIRVDPGALPESGESTWEMVTTDGANQLLRIKLQAVGQ